MLHSLRVGWFLAIKQIRRSNIWTTLLIIFIMTLTFLNLVVVGGILVGLPTGATLAYNHQYSGDVILRNLPTKDFIEQSERAQKLILSFPEVVAISSRYVGGATVESNYKTAIGPGKSPDRVAVSIAGIDPNDEDKVTELGSRMLEGEMLREQEEGFVMIGKNLLDQYTLGSALLSATTLKGVHTGSQVRITVNGHAGEFTVKGILGSKSDQVSTRVFITAPELRRLLGRDDRNVDEIAIRLNFESKATVVRDDLRRLGIDKLANVETSRESQGNFLDDIEQTFVILSSVIGGIGLLVASITVFIVIFINAVTRQKYIGILKGIGISSSAIEISYILQSIFYAVIGATIGLMIIYLLLVPYFSKHPIDFPFADGVLLVPYLSTFLRAGVLVLVTIIAGYFPARMIVSKNTLDSILGR